MARKSRRDWLQAGIEALSTRGVDALAIDRLAERLGVTKGSFYHHFANQADYRGALLALWEEEGMPPLGATATTTDEALADLDRLIQLSPIGTRRNDPGLAIRSWAARDPSVRAFVERVDNRRLKQGESLLAMIVEDHHRARFLSRMLYALILGCGHMVPPVGHKGLLALYEEFKRLLVADSHPSQPADRSRGQRGGSPDRQDGHPGRL